MMKKKLVIPSSVLLIVVGMVIFQSCTKSINNESSSFNPIEKNITSNTGRNQISKKDQVARRKMEPLSVKEVDQKVEVSIKEGIPYLNKQGLKLIKGVINRKINIDSFLLSPVSENSFVLIPEYLGKDKDVKVKEFNSFHVTKVSKSPLSSKQYTAKKKFAYSYYSKLKKDSLVAYNLTWNYKGKRFNTICIVSLTSHLTIYDNIYSYALFVKNETQTIGMIGAQSPLVENFSEGGSPETPLVYYSPHQLHEMLAIGVIYSYGSLVAEASDWVVVGGHYDAHLKKNVITTYDPWATGWSRYPFQWHNHFTEPTHTIDNIIAIAHWKIGIPTISEGSIGVPERWLHGNDHFYVSASQLN